MKCELCEETIMELPKCNLSLVLKKVTFGGFERTLLAFRDLGDGLVISVGVPVKYCPLCGKRLEDV